MIDVVQIENANGKQYEHKREASLCSATLAQKTGAFNLTAAGTTKRAQKTNFPEAGKTTFTASQSCTKTFRITTLEKPAKNFVSFHYIIKKRKHVTLHITRNVLWQYQNGKTVTF